MQEKLTNLKKQKVEVENATKLKMIDQNKMGIKELQLALDLFKSQHKEDTEDTEENNNNNTEKENEIEDN